MSVLPPIVIALQGSSLTTGRLSADWVPRLMRDLQCFPEAVGPIQIYNMGRGSMTSAWGVTNAPAISVLKPTHILTEGFAINDCVDFGGGPAISRAQHIINIQTMVNEWRTNIGPSVDIGIQTMSSVSTGVAAGRPQLADYYADEIATGTTLGIRTLDNYAGWPKPLPLALTYPVVGGSAFVPWGVGGTWNPADKNANVALSGGNLIATVAGGTVAAAKNTINDTSDPMKYFQATVGAVGGGVSIGLGGAPTSLADGAYLGSDLTGIGYRSIGDVWNNGASVVTAPAYGTGDVIGIARDRTNAKVWFSKNGSWVNGDPNTNSGGLALSTAAPVGPAMSGVGGGSVTGDWSSAAPGDGDGLHPIYTGAVDTYLYPAILAYFRARMAEFW